MENNSSYTGACLQGGLPPCACACPLNFNPRAFLAKCKKGNFNGAYREYANQVIFPAIVSQICAQSCITACPDSISLLRLERACVSYADKKEPIQFNLPAREGSVAIIGGGLSGLACAFRLATRRYSVTIFERSDTIGGSLCEVLDKSVYAEEFALQFKYLSYRLETNREIKSIDGLDFDAVYISTGNNGNDFGLLEDWNRHSMATGRNGFFLGGELTGCSRLDALMQGMVAASSIDKYLQVASMTGQPETFRQYACMIPVEYENKSRCAAPITESSGFSREEAIQESERCRDCDCTVCKDSCEFLKHMDLYPRQVDRNARMANAHQTGLLDRVGTRMIVSCSLCGHCGAVCPQGINVEKILTKSRKMLFEKGGFPPALHEFYLRDMSLSLNEAYLAKAPMGYKTASYLFFPGCQMTASGTEYVEKAYRYMLDKYPDTALMMGCCGVPALWAGDEDLFYKVLKQLETDWKMLGSPKMVLACATCGKTFSTYIKELEWISLYEFICANDIPDDAAEIAGKRAVFDPCSSRNFPQMQDAVREIARNLQARLFELPNNRKKALCCGMGGHIYPANPSIFRKMLETAAGESDLPYITYCVNCRNLFIEQGKASSHILDHVFNLQPLQKKLHISEQKMNRLFLKKRLLETYWGESFRITKKKYTVKLLISEEIYIKMDQMLISEEDVYAVLEFSEKNNVTVLNTETGVLTGHLQIGIITYWVQYRKQDGFLEVINVYCHKAQVE